MSIWATVEADRFNNGDYSNLRTLFSAARAISEKRDASNNCVTTEMNWLRVLCCRVEAVQKRVFANATAINR